jgi:hypothetical protein
MISLLSSYSLTCMLLWSMITYLVISNTFDINARAREILGQNKSEELLRNISEEEDVNLPEDEQIRLKNMFRDSLTFD